MVDYKTKNDEACGGIIGYERVPPRKLEATARLRLVAVLHNGDARFQRRTQIHGLSDAIVLCRRQWGEEDVA